jgi:hypothetical protein
MDNARPIVRSSLQPLTCTELTNDNIRDNIRELNQKIIDNIRDIELPDLSVELQDDYDIYEPMEPEASKPEIGDFTPEAYDALISAELMLPKGDILLPAKVINRKRDVDGNPVGRFLIPEFMRYSSRMGILNPMPLILLLKICTLKWIMRATNFCC